MLRIVGVPMSEWTPPSIDPTTKLIVPASVRHVVHVVVDSIRGARHWLVMTSGVGDDLETSVFVADEQGALADVRPVLITPGTFAHAAAHLEQHHDDAVTLVATRPRQ